MSLDAFIDVDRLKSLDGYVRERILHRSAAEQDRRFFTGPFRLDDAAPDLPGTRMIYLATSAGPDNYYDLDRTHAWLPSADAADFPELMDFIATLPFAATGRSLIIYDTVARPVTAHRDHDSTELLHEFIWFRTNLDKPFFLLDPATGERAYVRSHSAWFDTVNQFHGADGFDGLSFSIRIDGRFTDAFRAQIPRPASNSASTPALWAALAP